MYHQVIGSVPLPEFENDPYVAAWLTVRVERSIEIQVPEAGELSWGPSTDEISNKMAAHNGPSGSTTKRLTTDCPTPLRQCFASEAFLGLRGW